MSERKKQRDLAWAVLHGDAYDGESHDAAVAYVSRLEREVEALRADVETLRADVEALSGIAGAALAAHNAAEAQVETLSATVEAVRHRAESWLTSGVSSRVVAVEILATLDGDS